MLQLPQVVVACSGPSLLKVDVWKPGWPVVAISTAIRARPFLERPPDYWCLCDRPHPAHGENHRKLWCDASLPKIVPSHPIMKGGNNVTRVPYAKGKDEAALLKKGRDWMDGKEPVLRDKHKSVTFCLGWLSTVGVQEIILCGMDLKTGKQQGLQYAYKHGRGQRGLSSQAGHLNQTFQSMKLKYVPSAKRHGIRLIAWSPGGLINKIVDDKYERDHQEESRRDRTVLPGL